MKKSKRLISWLLTGAMAVSYLGTISSVSAEETKTTGVVFSEGFEEWDVGVLADTAGSYAMGNLKFDLLENDKLEIAVNEHGNKALKITKGNTQYNVIRYVFPKQYEGNVNVTFDFLSEHNSRHFSEFGNLEYNVAQNNLYKYNHWQDHLYVAPNMNSGKLLNAFSSTAHNGYVNFSTTYNTVGNNSKTVYMGYSRNKKNAGVDNIDSVAEYSINSGTKYVPEKIYAIRWVVGAKDGYSGKDKATSADDTINAGVYWIDNITVSTDNPVVSDEVSLAKEDFEGYTGDIMYNSQYKAWMKYFSVDMADGDNVRITKDPVTNSKALRIEKGANGNAADININLGEVTDKVVRVSFDVRFQNHSRYFSRFPEFFDASGERTKYLVLYRDQLFWDAQGSGAGGTFLADKIRSASNKDEYVKFEYIFDLNNGKAYADVISSSVDKRTLSSAITKKSLKNFVFTLTSNANNATDTDGTTDNNGIYWIDNIRMEVVTLKLENSSIEDNETKVPASRNLSLTFNEQVADDAGNDIMVVKNGEQMLELDVDYNVTISSDSKTVTIVPVGGEWDYESNYTVTVGAVKGKMDIIPYEGTTINFATDEYSPILINDYFENFTLGQKWEGPGKVTTGNLTFNLTSGDSVEYAYDEETGLNGFKLIKSNADGDLDFIYKFPRTYTDGKYMVKVDQRVENHSKGHKRWPALLSEGTGDDKDQIDRMILRPPSYWLSVTGNLNVDRYGVDHSKSSTPSRFIANTTGNARTVLFGELSTGAGYRFGLYNPTKDSYISSLEPATTKSTLGGVLMKISSGGGTNYRDGYECGTQVDDDTVNNPDNFGIAWIYGVTVEKVTLNVKNTSFDSDFSSFSPDKSFTVTFNQKLDVNTVNTSNIELYEDGNKISAYEYTINLSEDEKTVTINPVSGIKYGTNYEIKVKKAVKAKDSQIAQMFSEKSYIINTVDYQDTKAPDITWSTLPNGIENVDYNTSEVILNTNGVLLDGATLTKENIKVFENGAEFDDYTVEPSGLYAVAVKLGALKKESIYKITVSGLLSGGSEGLPMTETFETVFTTRGDIYLDAVLTGITADGTKSYVSGELFNKSGSEISYQVIGVLKDEEENIISVAYGSNGTLADGGIADIEVQNTRNGNAKFYDLYIWDSIGTMKPLTKKAVLNPVNERTYGYDNYMDSTKPLTVTYIGGSITQQRNYTTPLSASLDTLFKADNDERKITYSVQGLGGTNSSLGLYRLEKDVIAKKPDLVFIEFAVNDTDSLPENRKKTMEGIIRKLMKLNHQPMVVLLDLSTANYKSLEVIEDWKPLMDAYGIGYVNVAQYIKDNEASEANPTGLYVWREDDLKTYPNATALTATDGVHPTASGGKVYADYIFNTISGKSEDYFKKITVVENPVTGFEYNNPKMVAWNQAEYDSNWTKTNDMSWTFYNGVAKATTAGATLTYHFTGTTIGLFVPKSKTGTAASYSIDNGAYEGKVSCYGNVSTDMPMMSMISTNLEEGEHTITITVDDADNVNFRFGHFIVD